MPTYYRYPKEQVEKYNQARSWLMDSLSSLSGFAPQEPESKEQLLSGLAGAVVPTAEDLATQPGLSVPTMGLPILGTWKTLNPPKSLLPGGSLRKELEDMSGLFRSKLDRGFFDALQEVQSKYGLRHLGGGAYKEVYEVPTQESTNLALAFQRTPPSSHQGRDVMWPGHVKGIVPLWWYERGMPLQDVRAFAMPKIERSPQTVEGRYWYGPQQQLDAAEIAAKLYMRGLDARDLHSGNVLPEWSSELGRMRPVLVDRGGIIPYRSGRGHSVEDLSQGLQPHLGGFREEQIRDILLTNPESWPALSGLYPSLSGPRTYPRVRPSLAPAPSESDPLFWSLSRPSPSQSLSESSPFSPPTPTPTPTPAPAGSSTHEAAVEALIRRAKGYPISTPEDFNLERDYRRLQTPVMELMLDEWLRKNPSDALAVAQAKRYVLPYDVNPILQQSRTPGLFTPPPSDIRDLVIERLQREGIIPDWMKQPGEFFQSGTSGVKDFWDRIIGSSPTDPFYKRY